MMRKIVSILVLIALMATLLAGCGKGREFLNSADISDYVEVCEYKGIEIDRASSEYQEFYVYFLFSDIYQYGVSEENIKNYVTFDSSAETTVEFGDIVNIDYTGYVGETAFDKGSATDSVLLIGSKYFVDTFEEQLIGAKPGETRDVHVTFPVDYKNEDLAGVKAKFVVKINSIAKEPEQLHKALKIDTKEEYAKSLELRTKREYLLDYLVKNSKFSDYPEDDVEILYEAVLEQYSLTYGIDLSTRSKDEVLKNYVYPVMKQYMILYYIYDTQELELLDSTIESQETTNAVISECYAVYDTTMNYLLDNVKIK